jgi:hypothetical protein
VVRKNANPPQGKSTKPPPRETPKKASGNETQEPIDIRGDYLPEKKG